MAREQPSTTSRVRVPPARQPPLSQRLHDLHQARVAFASVVQPHTLLVIAARAGEREILRRIISAMRARKNVLQGRDARRAVKLNSQPRVAVDALADPSYAEAIGEALERGVGRHDLQYLRAQVHRAVSSTLRRKVVSHARQGRGNFVFRWHGYWEPTFSRIWASVLPSRQLRALGVAKASGKTFRQVDLRPTLEFPLGVPLQPDREGDPLIRAR